MHEEEERNTQRDMDRVVGKTWHREENMTKNKGSCSKQKILENLHETNEMYLYIPTPLRGHKESNI